MSLHTLPVIPILATLHWSKNDERHKRIQMILVIGATGTVGRELVRQLCAVGQRPRVLTRNTGRAQSVLGDEVEIVAGDLARPDTLAPALDGITRAFLLTNANPEQITLHRNFITQAKIAGVAHVVRLSAFGVGPDATPRLFQWHWESEQDLTASGMDFTHLRPHFFMQNLYAFMGMIKSEHTLFAPMKDGRIGLVDIRDVAAVALCALTQDGHAGKTYEITGPEALSFADLARALSEVYGHEITYNSVPPNAAREGMTGYGMPDWLADALLELYAEWSDDNSGGITSVIQDVTGIPPRTFATFAKEFTQILGR
jgi:uncharacterized protein YbjT (DUF2867 family)